MPKKTTAKEVDFCRVSPNKSGGLHGKGRFGVRKCKCGQPVEAERYKFCNPCWKEQDPRYGSINGDLMSSIESRHYPKKKPVKKIVCLWGGPGTGKSTTCAALFSKLKTLGYDVEMNREYIKEWVWEKRNVLPGDQVYITAKQARREVIYMRENMDFIVTDSPLALSSFYGDIYDPFEKLGQAARAIVKQHHEICKHFGYKVEHFFLVRTKAYHQAGRNENEATAREYDGKIKEFLESYPINYKTVICDERTVDEIIAHLQEG